MPALAGSLPDYIECVTIIGDDDPSGARGAKALAWRLAEKGVGVNIKFLKAAKVM
jgi:hypothetical protein